jgi:hypothetical protein
MVQVRSTNLITTGMIENISSVLESLQPMGPDPRLTIYTRMEQEPLEWVTSESTRLTESSL